MESWWQREVPLFANFKFLACLDVGHVEARFGSEGKLIRGWLRAHLKRETGLKRLPLKVILHAVDYKYVQVAQVKRGLTVDGQHGVVSVKVAQV